ncbi:MAG: SAM-dependent DNA methyltransferase, partial [Spirochaetota bacterium]
MKLHGAFEEGDPERILGTEDFGYTTVTVNHPLRDEAGNINLDKEGNPKPDPKLKDTENIPL